MFQRTKRTVKTLAMVTTAGLAAYGTYGLVNQYYHYQHGLSSPVTEIPKLFPITDDPLDLSSNSQVIVDRKYRKVIDHCRQKLSQWKACHSIPGYVVGVSICGQNVWLQGDGYSDLENGLPCHPGTVMRIASISKSITATLLAKMVQDQKINLDKSIYDYLKDEQFPKKTWRGKPVDITVRQLAVHLGGIRHYKKELNDSDKKKDQNKSKEPSEFDLQEYYLQKYFPTVTDSLSLFKDDPLVAEPGKKFVYTTFGYTLLSAVMETQMKSKNFCRELMKFVHDELGMHNTYLDQNDPIIYNRSRYYSIDKSDNDGNKKKEPGRIRNVPYVDNSYKWAGGGLLSSVPDLLKFGNILLYSFKGEDRSGRPGYLSKDIVDEMWKPFAHYDNDNNGDDQTKGYGIGFAVIRDGRKALKAFTAEPPFADVASHSGGAVGASSILIIEPTNELIVAIIANFQQAGDIKNMAMQIAKMFAQQIENKTITKTNKTEAEEQKEIRELLLLTK